MAIDWNMVGAFVGIPGAVGTVSAFVIWAYRRNRQKSDTGSQAQAEQPPLDPHGLPIHESEGFVGRTTEMTTVVAALLGRHSLLIHGEPGIGKTALAVQSLGSPQVQQTYQGHQHYINLEGRTSISLVTLCDDVARSLGALDVLKTEDVDQKIPILIANLGSPPPLIAFNNADGPAAVAAIAAFRGRVMDGPLLVTSRDAIPGMTTLKLTPLKPEPAHHLFLSRAGRSPRADERKPVDDILAILDGNPQAIILTAGVFQDMNAADLLKALRSRPFDVVGPVRAAFDVSYDRLTQPQQRLFAALSVFAGPDFSAEAVQSLFDEDLALELGTLVGVSLLRRDQATGRYSIHPLLKQYARGKLEGEDALQLRLAAYYAQFTDAHDRPTEEHLNAVALDFLNIRGSVEWCLARSKGQSAALLLTELVFNLEYFLRVRGYWTERVSWGEAGVEAAKLLGNDQRLAIIAGILAIAYYQKGDLERARLGHLDAKDAFQRLKDDSNVAQALHMLGILAQQQGHTDEARNLYQQSLDIRKRLGYQQGIAQSLHNLAVLAQGQGHPDEARDLYQQSLDIKKRLGDHHGIAETLGQLGILAQAQGRTDEAVQLYQQSLDIAKRLGDQQGIARTLHQLGMLAYSQGRTDEAVQLYQQSLDIKKRLGDQRGIASTLTALGLSASGAGNPQEAARLLSEALQAFQRLDDQSSIAMVYHNLGNLAYSQGRTDEARDLYQQSLEIEKRLGDQQGIAGTLHNLGMLDEDAGRLHEAQQQFTEALAILERLGSPDAATARQSLQSVQEHLKQQQSTAQ